MSRAAMTLRQKGNATRSPIGIAATVLMSMSAASAAQAPKITDDRIPDAALVDRLEHPLAMPRGEALLTGYIRYYTEARVDGRDMIIGELLERHLAAQMIADGALKSGSDVNLVHLKDIRPVFDGGCGIVIVTYDRSETAPPRTRCNPAPG